MTISGSIRRIAMIGLVISAGWLTGARPALAADLTMGIAVEPDSVDPHFHYFGGNFDFLLDVYEPLVGVSADTSLYPVLAKSWKLLNDDTWEFDLRPGIKFHDGSPLTSADVAFTFRRARNVPHSPGGFGAYLNHVVSVDTTDPNKVIIHTDGPVPLLASYISRIGIISEHVGAQATTEDYNSGRADIGTGPYRFVSWARGDSIALKRNDSYWGPRPAWENVKIRYINTAAARVAAMLSGDVDLIDSVSVEDVPRLKSNTALRVREAPASNVIGFQIDVSQRKPPFITGPNGEPLDKNPLADLKVRQALSMAISREALRDRVLNGQVVTADQVMFKGQFGYDPTLKPLPYDPAQAKKLLATAGYPNGFRMTMQCQADRYPNGPGICQAVAQMFNRIGVNAEPVLIPHSVFIGHANKHEFSFFTMFMVVDTDEPGQALLQTFATQDPAKGWGVLNRGLFDNPTLNDALVSASHDMNPQHQETTERKAVDLSVNEVAWIPVLRPLNIEAMRAGLDHTPHADGYVLAADVHPVVTTASH